MSRHRQSGLGLRRAKAATNILVHPLAPYAIGWAGLAFHNAVPVSQMLYSSVTPIFRRNSMVPARQMLTILSRCESIVGIWPLYPGSYRMDRRSVE